MKETCYIVAHWNKYDRTFRYNIRGYAPSEGGEDILLEMRVLEFVSPNDALLRQLAAKVLREKKNKIIADAHVEGVAIDEEIQELLAIEDKSGQVKEYDDIPF